MMVLWKMESQAWTWNRGVYEVHRTNYQAYILLKMFLFLWPDHEFVTVCLIAVRGRYIVHYLNRERRRKRGKGGNSEK